MIRERLTAAKYNMRQVLMPYHDIHTGKQGFQLSMPLTTRKVGSEYSENDVLLLLDDGDIKRKEAVVYSFPIAREYQNRRHKMPPPRPLWGWIGFSFENEYKYARLGALYKEQGSVPLKEIPIRNDIQAIFTPYGIEKYEVEKYRCDSPFNLKINTKESNTGEFALELGPHLLGTMVIDDNNLVAVVPNELAFELGLWSSHLLRIAEVRYKKVARS